MNKWIERYARFMEMKPADKLGIYVIIMIIFWVVTCSPFMVYTGLMIDNTDPSLRDPTYIEVISFLSVDQTDKNTFNTLLYNCQIFTKDLINNARVLGLRSYFVVIQFPDVATTHAIIGFNTTDYGMCYFEPQTDVEMKTTGFTILESISN